MRLVCLLLVVLTISASAEALTLPPGIHPGSTTYYSKTKIKSAANSAKNNCTSITDYIFKSTIFTLELYLPTLLGSKLATKNILNEAIGAGLKRSGFSRTGISISKRLILPNLKNLHLFTPDTLFKKHTANFLAGAIKKRPTPGGLKLASKTAIEMAAESYYYTSSRYPPSPHLAAAERHLQEAISEYNSYTGLLDAFSLTYSKFTPEGYDKILGECLLTIDYLNQAKRQKQLSAIQIS